MRKCTNASGADSECPNKVTGEARLPAHQTTQRQEADVSDTAVHSVSSRGEDEEDASARDLN